MSATTPSSAVGISVVPIDSSSDAVVPHRGPDDGDVDDHEYECGYNELRSSSSSSNSNSNSSNGEDDGIVIDEGFATVGTSCGRFAAFQERLLGPLSPERAPGAWMILNAFALSWSFSLGAYLILLYDWYGNEKAASQATTTEYLVWSLLTTLVWVFEISLRAAFPPLDTVLVVSSNKSNNSGVNGIFGGGTFHSRGKQHQHPNHYPDERAVLRTWTAEESVVTLGTVARERSAKHQTVIATELLLAVFFMVETVLDCWNHWQHRHGGSASAPQQLEQQQADHADDDYEWRYDDYYAVDGEEDPAGDFSMLQQSTDILINVLAYVYMTYETYQAYYRSTTAKRNLHRTLRRNLSSTLLDRQHLERHYEHHHEHHYEEHYQQQQQQQQHRDHPQQERQQQQQQPQEDDRLARDRGLRRQQQQPMLPRYPVASLPTATARTTLRELAVSGSRDRNDDDGGGGTVPEEHRVREKDGGDDDDDRPLSPGGPPPPTESPPAAAVTGPGRRDRLEEFAEGCCDGSYDPE